MGTPSSSRVVAGAGHGIQPVGRVNASAARHSTATRRRGPRRTPRSHGRSRQCRRSSRARPLRAGGPCRPGPRESRLRLLRALQTAAFARSCPCADSAEPIDQRIDLCQRAMASARRRVACSCVVIEMRACSRAGVAVVRVIVCMDDSRLAGDMEFRRRDARTGHALSPDCRRIDGEAAERAAEILERQAERRAVRRESCRRQRRRSSRNTESSNVDHLIPSRPSATPAAPLRRARSTAAPRGSGDRRHRCP